MENENKDWFRNYSVRDAEQMEKRDWWTPEEGKYQVEFLSEAGEEYEVPFVNRVVKKLPFDVKVKKLPYSEEINEYVWGVTIGETKQSLFGQLVELAIRHKQLKGVKTEILIKGTGKNRTYIVPEILG